jgi:hypothetical protein
MDTKNKRTLQGWNFVKICQLKQKNGEKRALPLCKSVPVPSRSVLRTHCLAFFSHGITS